MERPRHTIHNVLAMMGGLIAGGVLFGLFCMLGSLIPATDQPALQLLQVALFLVGGLGGVAAYIIGGMALSRKRHVTFYRNDTKQEEPMLTILQDQKFAFPTMTFTVQDAAGQALAKMNQGQHVEAIPDYTEAIELEPALPLPYINRGIAYAETEQPAEAIADFERYLDLIPADDVDLGRFSPNLCSV